MKRKITPSVVGLGFILAFVLTVPSIQAAPPVQYMKSRITVKRGDKVVEVREVEFYFTGNALRTLTKCNQQAPNPQGCVDLFYNGAQQVVNVIDHSKKMVMKITKNDLDQLAKTMGPFIKQMIEMQKKQRQQAGQKPVDTSWKFIKTGKTQKIGSYSCTLYEIKRGPQAVGQQCIASYNALGIDETVVNQLFKSLATMMESFTSLFPEGMENASDQEPPTPWVYLLQGRQPPYQGMPLQQTVRSADGKVTVVQLVDAGSKQAAPSVFEIPPGYKVTTIQEAFRALGGAMQPKKPNQ